MKYFLIIIILLNFVLNIILLKYNLPFAVSISLFIFLCGLWILYLKNQKTLSGGGILSLLLTLSTFFVVESLLTSSPDGYLPKETVNAPILIPPDKGNAIFQKNGFRGKRPCKYCPENTIRIVTTGGSSTYGIPLYYSEDTYSAELQRLLDERRPGENYEILNGGIPGYGIMQIIDSLEQEILKFKPDVVTICAWFNDSSPIPSWYGYADKSDKDSYQTIKVLSAIQKIPGFKSIYNSRSFAFVRYYLLQILNSGDKPPEDSKDKKKTRNRPKPRMNVEEFEWGLEEVVKLSRKHNFLPVFIYEALNRTPELKDVIEGKDYYAVVTKIANKYDLPLVNTLDEMAKYREEWLFYDFIHPNKYGHKIIADNLYKTLFVNPLTATANTFLSQKGIDFQKPKVQKEYFFQIETESLKNSKISFKASTPMSDQNKTLLLSINSKIVQEFKDINNIEKEFTFTLPAEATDTPISNLEFKIKASTINAKSPIGNSGLNSPSHIYAKSGGKNNGWLQKIEIDGVSHTGNYDGYGVVVIGSVSGTVKDSRRFNFMDKSSKTNSFYSYINNLSKFYEDQNAPIVVITLRTDGFSHTDQKLLSDTFKLLGGSGNTPKQFESFSLIGVPGLQPGQAQELIDNKLLINEVGSKSDIMHKLINISDFRW